MSQSDERESRKRHAKPKNHDFAAKPPADLVAARGKLTVKSVSTPPKKVSCWACSDATGTTDLPSMERETVMRGGTVSCSKHKW